MVSRENTHLHDIIQSEQVLLTYLATRTNTNTHWGEGGNHEFEKEQGGFGGRKGGNDI